MRRRGEAEVEGHRAGDYRLAEGAVVRVPGHGGRGVGEALGRAQMVRMHEIDRPALNEGQRHAGEPDIVRLAPAGAAIGLADQIAAEIVEVMRGDAAHRLGHAVARRIVQVRGHRRRAVFHAEGAVARDTIRPPGRMQAAWR